MFNYQNTSTKFKNGATIKDCKKITFDCILDDGTHAQLVVDTTWSNDIFTEYVNGESEKSLTVRIEGNFVFNVKK